MSKHEERRFQRTYHATVGILTLFGGAALIALGVYLSVTDAAAPLDLDFSEANDGVLEALLRANVGAFVLGAFLVAVSIVSLLALSDKCLGKAFRVLFVVLAVGMLGALVLTCVVSSILVHTGDHEKVRNFLDDAWTRTAVDHPDVLCRIENDLQCRGFDDNDCKGCLLGTEPACTSAPGGNVCVKCDHDFDVNAANGCYGDVRRSIRNVYLPVAIVSGILSGVVLVDILMAFCL